MSTKPRDTHPGGPPREDDGPEPEPAPWSSDGYRYDRPPIADSAVHRLLDGLGATRFPGAASVSETSGQMVAQYSVGPASVPARAAVPVDEPSVLLRCTGAQPLPTVSEETVPMRLPRSERVSKVLFFALLVGLCVMVAVAAVRETSFVAPMVRDVATVFETQARPPVIRSVVKEVVPVAPSTASRVVSPWRQLSTRSASSASPVVSQPSTETEREL